MTLQDELNKLKSVMGNPDDFKMQLRYLYDNFKDDSQTITPYVENLLHTEAKRIEKEADEISLKMQLGDNAKMLPLSYIAKNYFNRNKTWLYQRINGNIVNGKPARFTEDEKAKFNAAIQDISKRIGSLSIL